MSEKNMKENLQSFAVKKVLDYMEGDLDKNLPKLLEWADKFDKENLYASQRKVFHDILKFADITRPVIGAQIIQLMFGQ